MHLKLPPTPLGELCERRLVARLSGGDDRAILNP
jgi:hypothetical protein